MAKFVKAKETGEPGNRLAVFVEVLKEKPAEHERVAHIHVAADPNPSEQERSCDVSLCLVHDKRIRCEYTVRQLGKGSTESAHVVTRGPKLVEVVISADGTEKKPEEYEQFD